MRTSKREMILDAALGVVGAHGVTAVTFESVAAASGLTKGGLLYHFASKDAMVLALHEHQAKLWEAQLIEALGRQPEEATEDERLAAYARVSAAGISGPELLLMLEASNDEALNRPWQDVVRRWTPDPRSINPNDPAALEKMAMLLAADGLWLHASTGADPMPTALREALAQHLSNSVRALNATP
ncbi:TetR family transcriptional regulator [Microbacterium sp. 1.5R]|uniref:TetR/AcrR family transcriptional regulator n=1 Tax=Microbacterium sp. 1.5R TaxID=1916917 RepID=UPI00090CBE40|nr:TetR/AcrR family transcriptional regulator [Microbacterium sp. 1.5R]APH44081.1 TetR family transcriptional regulator [Microbacterium sp. 1.5R]